MMAGKKPVFRQVEMRSVSPADQEGIVLVESEFAPGVGPSQNS
jgi:hypothetical protein